MARTTDFRCDLTGEPIHLAPVPLVVRLQVAVPPGAVVDPSREAIAAVSPLLARMLFRPDGSARPGQLELGAAAFGRTFTVDLATLEPAFDDPAAPTNEAAQLRATIAALQAQNRALQAAAGRGGTPE